MHLWCYYYIFVSIHVHIYCKQCAVTLIQRVQWKRSLHCCRRTAPGTQSRTCSSVQCECSKGWFILLCRTYAVAFTVQAVCQFSCGPLECSVHGHVAGVTRSTMAKAEEEVARRRSRDGGKYQIIKSLFKTTKSWQQRNRRRWHSFNLHKGVYHGRSTLFVVDSRTTSA